jgi:D-glycero-D-manno-heptose 1,7-bisphosphate phosphatase
MGVGAMKREPRHAVFLDRDGVINLPVVRDGKPYPPATVDEMQIFSDVGDALARLRSLDFSLFVVTNQPDVARGSQERSVVEAMHSVLLDRLPLDGIYVCYHDDADLCECRKPKSGLLRRAAMEHDIDLRRSYMVGDRWRDINCGRAAGCTSIFVDRGYLEPLRQPPHYRVGGLAGAADVITSLGTKETHQWAARPFQFQADL